MTGARKTCLLVAIALLSYVRTSDGVGGLEPFMQEGVLISVEDPSLAVAVEDSFRFIGRHPITIGDVAAGERFVYVDADDAVIKRLLIVQFEGFLPEVDDFFRYDLSASPIVAEYAFRSNGYAFDIAKDIAANPTKESAATLAFLQAKGYSAPDIWMMWRSLTVTDEARKKEMIVFYVEDVGSVGLTLKDLYADDSATQVWIDIQMELEVRANKAFQLAELDEDNNPIPSTWSSIPNTFLQ